MIKSGETFTTCVIVLFSSIVLLFWNIANATDMNPMTFCTDTCATSQCQTPATKQECKEKCADDRIWKHIASLELSKSSKEFRTEKDKTKKDAMLYSTSIAQCLDLKSEGIKESKPLAAPPIAEKTNEDASVSAKKEEQQDALKKKQDEATTTKAVQLETEKKKREEALAAQKTKGEKTKKEMLKRQQEQAKANLLTMQQKKSEQAQKMQALKKQHQEALQNLSPKDPKAAQELKRKQQAEQKALMNKHQEETRNVIKERMDLGKSHQQERIASGYN